MNIYDYYNKEIPLEKPQNKLYISPAKSFHTQQSPFLTTPKIKTNKYILQNITPKTLFSQNKISNNPIIKEINPNHISAIINYSSKKKLQRVSSYKISQKKTLILDIDETLVHSAFTPFNRPPDISLNIELNGFNREIYVLKRPHVDEFLEELSNIFEIITFTASLSQYAGPLLDKLDKCHIVNHRLFRENCIHQKGIFIKDLRKVGRDLKNIIIIDNNPISYIVNMDNGLPISTWYDDINDNELMKLIPLLKYLSNVEDVRPIIRQIVNRKINKIDFNIVNQLINGNNDNIVNASNRYISNRVINYTMISKNITNSLSNMSYNDYLKNLDNINVNSQYNPQNYSVYLYNKKDIKDINPDNKENNNNIKKNYGKNTKKNHQIKLNLNNIINSIKLRNNKKSHKNMTIKNNTHNNNNNKIIKNNNLVNKLNNNENDKKKLNINTINNNKNINNSRNNIIKRTKKIVSLNSNLTNNIKNKKDKKNMCFDSPKKFPEDNKNQKKKQNSGSPQDSNSKNKKKSLNFIKIIKLKKNMRNKNRIKTFNIALEKYDKIINNSLPVNITINNVNFNNEMLINIDSLDIKNQTPKKTENENTVSIIRQGFETDNTKRTKNFISKKFDKYNEINRNKNNDLIRNKTENVVFITNYENKNKSQNKKENTKSNSYIKKFKSNTHLKIKKNSFDNKINSDKKKEKKKIKNINVNIKKINRKKLKKDINKNIPLSKELNIDNNKYNENIVFNDIINSQIIYPEKKYTSENVFKFTDNYTNPFINEQIDGNFKNYYFNKSNNSILNTNLGQYMKFERNKDLYNNSLDIFYPENSFNFLYRNNLITIKNSYNNSDYISSLDPYNYLINNNENSYLYNI